MAGDDDDRLAYEREAEADERETQADEREREADQRERKADQRESRADNREKEIDRLAGEFGFHLPSATRRAFEVLDRIRARLGSAGDQVDRSEAALRRAVASAERGQTEINREVAQSERNLAREAPAAGDSVEYAKVLRKSLTALAADLAETEEEAARMYDEQAARQPEDSGELGRAAAEARRRAQQANDIVRMASD